MPENTPILDCLTEMTAVSIAEGSLEAREHCSRGWPRSSQAARPMRPTS